MYLSCSWIFPLRRSGIKIGQNRLFDADDFSVALATANAIMAASYPSSSPLESMTLNGLGPTSGITAAANTTTSSKTTMANYYNRH